ncbi:MAG: hypothetical protein QM778_18730 [Myxococcales bacterium]
MDAPGRSSSGSKPPGLGDVILNILSGYVSSINARSLLARSVASVGGSSRDEVDERNLAAVLQRLQISAALFVPEEQRGELQQKFDRLKQEQKSRAPQVAGEVVQISQESDIVLARTRARLLCEQLGSGTVSTHKVATVVSELARNIVSYTPGGSIEFAASAGAGMLTIQAVDRGSGIKNLNEIFEGQYRSKTGLGMGLVGTRRLADSFHIDTGPSGTTVTVRMRV